ncbi:DUF4393 domain-containing protein [Dickeya zeae]|uniref:DUF4393 domain-containing protein n=1 Tax=Dickeya zeae TaxID=204042 RepID=UPI00205DEE0B|nr:DUF4393 domain-containing protein [Dickeya zeae]UPT55497.1 DUF4393 domain-containing protein [Dickeya zeae]
MSDEKNNENVGNTSGNNKVAETINAATGLVKAIPVYQDLAQPAAQELGKSLHTVAKLVNVVLAPVSACVWGYEKIKEFVDTKVADKLKNTNPDDIISPAPNVAGPALEALKYTGCNETLSDMYACLLASAMDKNKADEAHPAFVEIIRQLTSDEARIMSFLSERRFIPLVDVKKNRIDNHSGITVYSSYSEFEMTNILDLPKYAPSGMGNLCRLGLANIPEYGYINNESLYHPLVNSDFIKELLSDNTENHLYKRAVIYKMLTITNLGSQFIKVCSN